MKRKFKRIASMVLAMVMVFAMAVPAMVTTAAGNRVITINNVPEAGHVFEAYQVFGGTTLGTEDVLGDPSWGAGLSPAGQVALANKLLDTDYADVSSIPIADVIDKMSKILPKDLQALFIEILGKDLVNLGAVAGNSSASSGSEGNFTYKIENLEPGYYLVIDKEQTDLADEDSIAYSLIIVQIANEDATVDTKVSVPTSDKKVMDTNDSTGTTGTWQDAADYDIGDHVPFQLHGTVDKNYKEYETYHYKFVDELGTGLSYINEGDDQDSYKVIINETELTKEEVDSLISAGAFSFGLDGQNLSFEFTDLKTIGDTVTRLGDITITNVYIQYTATLNDTAVVGPGGNPNTMHLEYSNNPNGDGTGKTPEDKVKVFTFEVDVKKVDGDIEELEGAGFTLYKWVAGEDGTSPDGYEPPNSVQFPEAATPGYWKKVEEIPAAPGRTTFEFKRVDAGIYKLVESETPDGYNTCAPVDFEITAAYEGTSADPKLTAFNAQDPTKGTEFTAQLSSGVANAMIQNQKGATLPETGGIGTTIFYVVGSVLVLAAVILLVTKKRMKSK